MLITRELEININHRVKNYYDLKGYNINKKTILVKIEDIPKNSSKIIKCSCDDCGKEFNLSFQNYNKGLKKNNKTICRTCIKKYFINPFSKSSTKEKIKKTLLNKYNVDNPLKSDIIIKKKNNTMLRKYGSSYSFDNIEIDKKRKDKIKNRTDYDKKQISEKIKKKTNYKESRNKFEKTMIEKYGVKNALQNNNIKSLMIEKIKNKSDLEKKLIKEKIKNTYLNNYGVIHPYKLNEFKEKSKITKRKNSILNFVKKYNIINVIDIDYDNELVKLNCNKHGEYEISLSAFYHRNRNNHKMCIKCNKIGSYTNSEKELLEFIKNNYDGLIQTNTRKIFNNKFEIDIYLPDLKLGFEFNGLYWHSELYKNKNYHLNKTELCENLGIRLIHIYEDQWTYKQDIVKSRILNLLGKNQKIYARKCDVEEISDNKLIRKFLENNHIQGFVGSKVKIGLFYNNELVSLMTFGDRRVNMNQNKECGLYEMLRFCNKLNTNVIGGASRLFKYFVKNYNPIEVISYADRSWSKGDLYEKLGFNLEHKTKPNYYYIIDNIRKYRFGFRKDILIKNGFDKNKTEHEIMLERGIHRIYDSGNLKYKYIF